MDKDYSNQADIHYHPGMSMNSTTFRLWGESEKGKHWMRKNCGRLEIVGKSSEMVNFVRYVKAQGLTVFDEGSAKLCDLLAAENWR